jgi:hypothetical protein
MGLSFTISAGPRQRSHSQVRVPLDSRPHFTVSDSRLHQPGPGSCIYIPQEQGGPVILPGSGFPFRRPLRLDSASTRDFLSSAICHNIQRAPTCTQDTVQTRGLSRSNDHGINTQYCDMLVTFSASNKLPGVTTAKELALHRRHPDANVLQSLERRLQ